MKLRQGDRILADALGIDAQEQIDAAAELGLGSKAYELVEVESKH